jgi:thioredoxin-like negative regulator of GroEL
MSRPYAYYDVTSGLFSARSVLASSKSMAEANAPAGYAAIEGRYDRLTQRVDVATGNVVAYERAAAEIEAEQQAKRAERARHRIEVLERAQHRPMRELAIDPNNAEAKRRLAEIETEIEGLRGQLKLEG